jgi:RimJ/RimL family protein N-acetyltransferase
VPVDFESGDAWWERATEGARAALRVGFERLELADIVSFTSVLNVRSRAVMERIGMRNVHEDFEHPGVPEKHSLRPHCLYRITRAPWSENVRGEEP